MNRLFMFLGIIVGFFIIFIVFSDYCVACGCVICKSDFTSNVIRSDFDVVRVVSVSDFNNLLSEDVILIDIRTPQEFVLGNIENATNIDFYSSSFRDDINALDKNKTYLIYCRSGSRTNEASQIMKSLGFKEVYVLGGGINAWISNDFSVITN
jgi:rhodanese-related sulfurtransferase